MRIAGIMIPDEKRLDIALTYIYGIGRNNVKNVLTKAQVEPSKKVKSLSEEEQRRVQKSLEELKTEGDLKAEVAGNIKRLKEIGAYRGIRHSKNLPVRGQRTRSNARTKRGKRVTIGAIKKEMAQKMGLLETPTAPTGGRAK
ncbi:MAG: 30S ribosomal protein S13 [Candidatus Levybacteria bacterium RIFCSPHIGHO2_02_FULL_42_12]|nr:MAG: 30S ribosomal protein S13 [Candidatus Levybacteria bacterium RIFCSPHIGHO2_01_FULL_42_15]OGH31433.1 MAG: 30S ribosomal protein S13 [Candidatus Levybacteria bacterium RIFCSPHIGHO2_02_FULL_42_12]OGH42697.1 MAG: 30S ribosomal protein S13 [Candidatus Levybacteria bacterium RIFCSPLOWO2_01_FULL_42_15]